MLANELKEYIIQKNLTEDLLYKMGCKDIKDCGEYYMTNRPLGDNPKGCQVWKNSLSVKIYTPHEGTGDIYNLVSATYNIDFFSSIKKITSLLGIYFEGSMHKNNKKDYSMCILKYKNTQYNLKNMKYYNDEIISDYIQLPNLLWVKEGILPNTQIKYEIGYDLNSHRITIPHFSLDLSKGKYIGIMGRTMYDNYELFGIPKYLPLVEFPKSQSLYGYMQNYLNIQQIGYCIIYESEKSVLLRDSKRDYTAIALGGTNISKFQEKMLLALNVPLIFAFDGGIELKYILTQCERFYKYRNVYYIYNEELLEGKKSPADLSQKDFYALFNSKIKYTKEE